MEKQRTLSSWSQRHADGKVRFEVCEGLDLSVLEGPRGKHRNERRQPRVAVTRREESPGSTAHQPQGAEDSQQLEGARRDVRSLSMQGAALLRAAWPLGPAGPAEPRSRVCEGIHGRH